MRLPPPVEDEILPVADRVGVVDLVFLPLKVL